MSVFLWTYVGLSGVRKGNWGFFILYNTYTRIMIFRNKYITYCMLYTTLDSLYNPDRIS